MGCQRVRRTRELEGNWLFAAAERGSLPRGTRHPDDCRRFHRLASRVAPGLRRRAWFRLEMGHGLDARYAKVLHPRSDSPALPSRLADVSPGVCLLGKLRPGAL